MTPSELARAINDIAAVPKNVTPEERAQLLAAADNLRSALESPFESALRIVLSGSQAVFLRLAIDMKLFDGAMEVSKDGDRIQVDTLASKLDVEPLLLARLMRALRAMGMFKEVAKDTYALEDAAKAYVASSPIAQGVLHMTSQNEVLVQIPNYFAEKGYKSPEDAYDGPFQYARNTKLHSFDWIATKPRLQHAFNTVMQMPRQTRTKLWHEVFPVFSKLHVKTNDDPLLVDIGGGVGHNLVDLQKSHPELQGKLILQDIPVVIDSVKDLPAGIYAMKHDFFSSQPVKGAKAYFLANVIHDWPDKQALEILSNIKEAMSSESLLLINENVLPDVNVSFYSAVVDWTMMSGLAALERTQMQYEKLLDEAGFKVVKTWAAEGTAAGNEKLFEAVPK